MLRSRASCLRDADTWSAYVSKGNMLSHGEKTSSSRLALSARIFILLGFVLSLLAILVNEQLSVAVYHDLHNISLRNKRSLYVN